MAASFGHFEFFGGLVSRGSRFSSVLLSLTKEKPERPVQNTPAESASEAEESELGVLYLPLQQAHPSETGGGHHIGLHRISVTIPHCVAVHLIYV